MANNNNNHKAGRPRKEIDWDLIGQLAAIFCTEEEIAFVLKCAAQTLLNHCIRTQGCTFEDYLEKHRGKGRVSLRRKQFEVALEGDKTMLIWLGKQYLSQSDKQEVASTVNVKLSAEDLSDDQLAGIIARGRSQRITATAVGPVSSN